MGRKKYTKNEQELYSIKPLTPKNSAQEFYLSTLNESTITFCTGPAGTGKTFLASWVALEALKNREIDKIILTRPIVAVEDIGYLPGTMDDKIHPYVLPLLDAIEMHIGPLMTKSLLFERQLEVVPLAYMRGRSLNRSFMILDEAQNTTKEQMKMFLTRLGYGSRMSINGDASQSDLPRHIDNGLAWAVQRLTGVEAGISTVEFTSGNIVRNPLIEKMLKHLDGPAQKSTEQAEKLGQSALLGGNHRRPRVA